MPIEISIIETREPPVYQRIAAKAAHLRELGIEHVPVPAFTRASNPLGDVRAFAQLVGRLRDVAHDAVAELLLHLERDVGLVDDKRFVYVGDLVRRKLDVHDSANDLYRCSTAHTFYPLTGYGGCTADNF